jgi:ribosomal protein S12
MVRINRADVTNAYELVKDMPGIKFKEITGDKENRAVTKRALMDQEDEYEEDDE